MGAPLDPPHSSVGSPGSTSVGVTCILISIAQPSFVLLTFVSNICYLGVCSARSSAVPAASLRTCPANLCEALTTFRKKATERTFLPDAVAPPAQVHSEGTGVRQTFAALIGEGSVHRQALPDACATTPSPQYVSAVAAAPAASPRPPPDAMQTALLQAGPGDMAATSRLDLLLDRNAKLAAQCDVQRKQLNELEKRQAPRDLPFHCSANALPARPPTRSCRLRAACQHEKRYHRSDGPSVLLHQTSPCLLRPFRAGRLEEAAAKEDAHQATLLCVNRLWEELNASIGFIQYR